MPPSIAAAAFARLSVLVRMGQCYHPQRTSMETATTTIAAAKAAWQLQSTFPRSTRCYSGPSIDDIRQEDVEAVQRFRAKYSRDMIPYKMFTTTFQRSGGAGGQNVNKVNTKVYMRFSLDKQAWIPKYIRLRMRELDANRINGKGEYLVTSERTRTQRHNLEDCLDKIWESLDRASTLPKGPDEETIRRVEGLKKVEKARNKESKRRLSERKANRRRRDHDD